MREFEHPLKREPRLPPSEEKYTIAQLFEFLFPENRFEDLPLVSTQSIKILFELYSNKSGFRDLRFELNVEVGKSFAEREDLSNLSRMLMRYYVGGLTPYSRATHPTMFKGHIFSDLVNVQVGEKLGGIATRQISGQGALIAKLESKMGLRPYLKHPEYILGVLNGDNRPCAIIHFGEGDTPRRVKSDKVSTVANPLLKPFPILSR